jgi:hypothetical protein
MGCGSSELRARVQLAERLDAHRAGDWKDRRCLALDSRIARGMRLNRGGRWIARMRIPRRLSCARAAISPGPLLPQGGHCAPVTRRPDLAEALAASGPRRA